MLWFVIWIFVSSESPAKSSSISEKERLYIETNMNSTTNNVRV
jgi:hypothetical protein